MAAEQFCQLNLLRDLVVVGAVDQRCRLILNRLDHLGMAMSQIVNGHTGQKIQILLAISIPQTTPLTTHRDNRVATVGLHNHLI